MFENVLLTYFSEYAEAYEIVIGFYSKLDFLLFLLFSF